MVPISYCTSEGEKQKKKYKIKYKSDLFLFLLLNLNHHNSKGQQQPLQKKYSSKDTRAGTLAPPVRFPTDLAEGIKAISYGTGRRVVVKM